MAREIAGRACFGSISCDPGDADRENGFRAVPELVLVKHVTEPRQIKDKAHPLLVIANSSQSALASFSLCIDAIMPLTAFRAGVSNKT